MDPLLLTPVVAARLTPIRTPAVTDSNSRATHADRAPACFALARWHDSALFWCMARDARLKPGSAI